MPAGCAPCQARKDALNGAMPGLGDRVAVAADPIYERWNTMPEMLRPDMKSVVWLLIGAIVVPMVLKRF